jgi:hypothetical protein
MMLKEKGNKKENKEENKEKKMKEIEISHQS